MDWVAHQACLEDKLPGNPTVNDEEAIDKCVEELSNAIQEALAASAPRRRPRPKRAITFLTKLFNAVLRRQYIPPAWKHARVVSILKPGKDPTLPSSYRLITLLDTVGKLFEKILLARVLREVNERGL
jgi:hypothetical protein